MRYMSWKKSGGIADMQRNIRGSIVPIAALTAVTAVWGSTFFMIKDLVTTLDPFDFLGVRFLIAGTVIGILRFSALKKAPRQVWIQGIALGLVYSLAQFAQTVGLKYTDASVSGFITGMYVVLTPLVLWAALRIKIRMSTWIAVVLATAGLGVLSLNGFALGYGEMLTLLGALLFAVHIVLLGQWASHGNPMELAALQIMSVGVFCMMAALPGGIALPQGMIQWSHMLYMALVAGMLALVAQTWAQARLAATFAAIIMTTEPLFAAIFAVLFGGEHLTIRLVIGGLGILIAMFIAELSPAPDESSPAEKP